MKLLIFASLSALCFFSCSKKINESQQQIYSETVFSESNFTEMVWYNHTVTGEWNDKTSFVNQPGITEFAGDSWFENMIYERSWKTVYVPLTIINRGIGGTTFTTNYPYLDSSAKYARNLKTINIHLGINEYLQFPFSSNKNVLASFRAAAIKYYKRARVLFPNAQINLHEIEASPKLIKLGYKSNIVTANLFFDSLVKADVSAGKKAIIVKTNTIMGTNDMLLYKADSIHPNGTGYERMQSLIVSSVRDSKGTIPSMGSLPTGNKPPVASAGADQSYSLLLGRGLLLNANASSDSDGKIARFQWAQVTGPNQARLSTSTQGTTKVSGIRIGKYIFRVTVYDNKGASASDEVTVNVGL